LAGYSWKERHKEIGMSPDAVDGIMALATSVSELAKTVAGREDPAQLAATLARLDEKISVLCRDWENHKSAIASLHTKVEEGRIKQVNVESRVAFLERVGRWVVGPSLVAAIAGLITICTWLIPAVLAAPRK